MNIFDFWELSALSQRIQTLLSKHWNKTRKLPQFTTFISAENLRANQSNQISSVVRLAMMLAAVS